MESDILKAFQERSRRSSQRRADRESRSYQAGGNDMFDRIMAGLYGGVTAGVPGAVAGFTSTPKEVVIRDKGSSDSNAVRRVGAVNNLLQGLMANGGEGVPEEAVEDVVTETVTETPTSDTVQLDDNTVEYTYKDGDTFGQVIKDLGFMTDNGLWGNNGDARYYEKQLQEQGIKNGNIPVGTKIRLRKRPAVQYDIYGNRIR